MDVIVGCQTARIRFDAADPAMVLIAVIAA